MVNASIPCTADPPELADDAIEVLHAGDAQHHCHEPRWDQSRYHDDGEPALVGGESIGIGVVDTGGVHQEHQDEGAAMRGDVGSQQPVLGA